eukprot:1988918-Rhodomonas_salina.1
MRSKSSGLMWILRARFSLRSPTRSCRSDIHPVSSSSMTWKKQEQIEEGKEAEEGEGCTARL